MDDLYWYIKYQYTQYILNCKLNNIYYILIL